MVFLAGIDEAGYGPFVGPLTMGFSLWRVPDIELDLWKSLSSSTARKPGRKDSRRLWLDDSKKVHQGPHGRSRLERTVAAFRQLLEEEQSLASWIGSPPAPSAKGLHAVPWFAEIPDPLCPSVALERARLDAAGLSRDMDQAGISLTGFGARAVPAKEWNGMLESTGGKGSANLAVAVELLRHLFTLTGDAPLRVELDRHGGRQHYARVLQAALQPERVETHAEHPSASLYSLHFPHRTVQLRFSEAADHHHVPVALASLAAKLTRERMMDLFNAWWKERLPEVKGTKGYGVDGKRFLAEVLPQLGAQGVEESWLRRNK